MVEIYKDKNNTENNIIISYLNLIMIFKLT